MRLKTASISTLIVGLLLYLIIVINRFPRIKIMLESSVRPYAVYPIIFFPYIWIAIAALVYKLATWISSKFERL